MVSFGFGIEWLVFCDQNGENKNKKKTTMA